MTTQTKSEIPTGWTLHTRKKIFTTPVVDIYSGPVHCKRSKAEKTFYYLDFPDWVNVIATTSEDDLILIRQFRYGTRKEEIEIPGGVIEAGESPVAAGCRELARRMRLLRDHCPDYRQGLPKPRDSEQYLLYGFWLRRR